MSRDASLIGVFAAEAGEPPPPWHLATLTTGSAAECTRPVLGAKPGRPPTTDRSPGRGGTSVRVNLSAAEHAALTAHAAPMAVASWLRGLALRALPGGGR